MDEDKIRKIVEQVFDEKLKTTQFNVSSIPFHTHNGTDSINIPPLSVTNFIRLPSNNTSNDIDGVPDLYAGVISRDNISPFVPAPLNVSYPTSVIEGFQGGSPDYSTFHGGDAPLGSTMAFYDPSSSGTIAQLWVALEASQRTELNFTGVVAMGATSATLAADWIFNTGDYKVTFSNGNVRLVTLTNLDTTATWTGGLSSGATAVFNVEIFTQWFGVNLPLTP